MFKLYGEFYNLKIVMNKIIGLFTRRRTESVQFFFLSATLIIVWIYLILNKAKGIQNDDVADIFIVMPDTTLSFVNVNAGDFSLLENDCQNVEIKVKTSELYLVTSIDGFKEVKIDYKDASKFDLILNRN